MTTPRDDLRERLEAEAKANYPPTDGPLLGHIIECHDLLREAAARLGESEWLGERALVALDILQAAIRAYIEATGRVVPAPLAEALKRAHDILDTTPESTNDR